MKPMLQRRSLRRRAERYTSFGCKPFEPGLQILRRKTLGPTVKLPGFRMNDIGVAVLSTRAS